MLYLCTVKRYFICYFICNTNCKDSVKERK